MTAAFDPPTVETHLAGGGGVNEDRVGSTDNAVWVLDGATGLTEESYTDSASDGAWYVDAIDEALRARIGESDTVADAVRGAVESVAADFEASVDDESVDEAALPSGAIAAVRADDAGGVEYFVLGDCGVVFGPDDDPTVVLGEGPRELDAKAVAEMRTHLDSGAEYEEARAAIQDTLEAHRRMKNEAGGYWTLGLDPAAVEHAAAGRVSGRERSALLFTDGFDPVVGNYDIFADWGAALEYVDRNGLERAVRVLRAVEATDPECRTYPRLKPSDDVGVAFVGGRR